MILPPGGVRAPCVHLHNGAPAGDCSALLAAIDELTQRVTWMTTDSEGNVIDFAADLDVAVRALNAAELDNVLKQRAIDELTAKSVVIDATVAAFAGDKSAVVRSLRARIDDLTAQRDAVLALHEPMANTHPLQPACPDCLGGIYAEDPEAARPCGCWGLLPPVCGTCAVHGENSWWLPRWPCPTVVALDALTKAVQG